MITSPNYPESYATKTQLCNWWIIAPYASRGIKLQFVDLELPMRGNCNETDHVTVWEKTPEKQLEHNGNVKMLYIFVRLSALMDKIIAFGVSVTEIGKYCGRNKPDVIDILTSEAVVSFTSSFTNTRLPFARGFRLNYTFNHDGRWIFLFSSNLVRQTMIFNM